MATLRELTAAAGIQHVVWVDDLFDESSHTDSPIEGIDLRALVVRFVERRLTVTIADRALGPDLTTDEWIAELEELQQNGATTDDIRQALRDCLAGSTPEEPPDYSDEALKAIMASFGEEMLTTAGSVKWPEVRPTLSLDRRTLLILDREFSVAGVSTAFGEQVLQDVLRAKIPKLHVVMLTRSVDEDPETLRTELAARLGISRQEFEISAKAVSDEPGLPESRLCGSFQRIFTHQVCINLTRSIRAAMVYNLESAVETLAAESVYDLDRVVFQNSLEEGASELDVLTRILLLRQRVAVDAALASGDEYFEQVAKLRTLRELAGPLISDGHDTSGELENWRRDEVCDPSERINPSHSPLVCGDVFAHTGSNDVFVLLGQPCDLAVRPNGHRNTHEAIFVLAKQWDRNKEQKDGRVPIGALPNFLALPALPLSGSHEWRLDFRKWSSVNLRVLDFAVFSGNGAVQLNTTMETQLFLLPGWKKLLDRAKKRIRAQQQLPGEYRSLSLSELLKQAEAAKTGDVVALPYSRVGRLRAPWAVHAYASFASHQARTAFDHDFAAPKRKP